MNDPQGLTATLRRDLVRLYARFNERKRMIERFDLTSRALYGEEVQELNALIDEHADMVYEALRSRPNPLAPVVVKYQNLVQICSVKRTYEVPPEYSGILNVENRIWWSPTDTELARVLVSATVVSDSPEGGGVPYVELVRRIGHITSMSRSHIYRSLKEVLRNPPERGGMVVGLRLL